MAGSADSRKVQQWQRRLARFQKSRLTVAPFCQDEGVSVASFYQWRKKLPQLSKPTAEAVRPAASFRPVRLVTWPSVAVRLPGGTELDVPASDPELLQLALQTLAQVDSQRVTGSESC